ncbi:uncharacterized protein LOC100197857 isoform X2 [Hydra vulgaris]|uniref:uncharacterized protein LOC100197857 isoform X2 n=1 Tax=Hydra vulgaris TaxID=6087 RepID=UPI0032EA2D51
MYTYNYLLKIDSFAIFLFSEFFRIYTLFLVYNNFQNLFEEFQKILLGMSEATVEVAEIAPVSKIQIKPNFGFLYTPPGILMAVNIVLLFFAWVIIAGWKENAFWSYRISSSISYFLLITVLPFFVLGLLFIAFLFKINTKVLIDWPLCAFGFFASIGLAIQGLFHFREYRNPVLTFNPVN